MRGALMSTFSDLEIAKAKLLKLDYDCSQDPVLFFNTMLYTFDPKRAPYHLAFKLFEYQEIRIVNELVQAIEMGYDIFFDKTREMGVSYTCLGVLLWYWKYQDASNFLLGSRKEDYVDNVGGSKGGDDVSNKEESLFGKLDYMLARLNPLVLPKGFGFHTHRSSMKLLNPALGNSISGESSNPNFSRGGRQKGILLDEFAFWDNDDAAWGSTADTTNCRIVITTPGIRPGTKAKRLRFGEDGEKIRVIELPHYLDPRKTPEWLADQRERRSKEDFAREIMIDWEGSIKGTVYPEARRRKVGNFPFNPQWPLFVSWDFGLDGTALQWWQYNMDNGKMRLLDAFTKPGMPIQWFFPFFPNEQGTGPNDIDSMFQYAPDELDTINRVNWFVPAKHYGDPDAAKRSMTSKSLTSVRAELFKVGIIVQSNTKANTFYNRREATKLMLQKGIEVNDTPGTTGLNGWLDAIDQASYPQREATSQATTAIALPIHNWTSHPRTATEYMAVNFKKPDEQHAPGVVVTAPPSETGLQPFMIADGYTVGNPINIRKAIRESVGDE
jgi:hypothetical protein